MRLNKNYSTVLLLGALSAIGCTNSTSSENSVNFSVENKLDFDRNEVISITTDQLSRLLDKNSSKDLRLKIQGQTDYLPLQWIDYDGDGKEDEVVFFVNAKANQTINYEFVVDSVNLNPQPKNVAYSRFVPERVDDYTWENDKIAFRVYGPKGQESFLQGVKGSTLSSGVDIWLKRTSKSVINEWYAGYTKDPMHYHVDKGEGYDPYHVGDSRGVGGSGVWVKDSLQISQNFVTYKTISEGPLRTVFELTYNPWSDYKVTETKRISLDVGSNFSKFEVFYKSVKPLPNYTVGISLHKNEGTPDLNVKNGWFSHWEKIDDAFVGEGIVLDPAKIDSAFANVSKVVDQSNLLILTKPEDKLTYYAGFAWQKSGQVNSKEDWQKMLDKKAKEIASPLVVKIK